MLAKPQWSDRGEWGVYAGPGAVVGLDIFGDTKSFSVAAAGQVGLEYSFDFPLLLAVDMRPCIGLHVNTGKGARVGFYDNGLLGLVPNLSVRYRF